jgi:hypothetical protein
MKITRFEQNGEQLFICINSETKPVYLEHFFTEEEKLDQAATIERLMAELSIKEDTYVAPEPVVSLMDTVANIVVDEQNITAIKSEILTN